MVFGTIDGRVCKIKIDIKLRINEIELYCRSENFTKPAELGPFNKFGVYNNIVNRIIFVHKSYAIIAKCKCSIMQNNSLSSSFNVWC